MNENTKKYLMIGFTTIAVCIAGFVFYKNAFSNNNGTADVDQTVVLMCKNCGGFEISVKEFNESAGIALTEAMLMTGPDQNIAILCPKCGKKTCYMAQKCDKCGEIYIIGQARDRKYPDRCPKCGYSKIEDIQKKAN